MHIDDWLQMIPPLLVYLMVGGVISLESLGIPLPGEIVLVSAALLASRHIGVDPLWVGIAGSTGAIIGDSIGYAIGRAGGRRIFDWASRKFPKHFGPEHIANAERVFQKRGVWAVFFGRFVAFLRILSGPLAGSLHMHYPKFLVANTLGGITWAGGTTAAVYYLGIVADQWFSRFSYAALGLALVAGVVISVVVKKRVTHPPCGRDDAHTAAERLALTVRAVDRRDDGVQ